MNRSRFFVLLALIFAMTGLHAAPLTVNDCIKKTLDNNIDIRNVVLSYKQNNADMIKTLARYVPALGGAWTTGSINEPSASSAFASYPMDINNLVPNVSMGIPGGGFVKLEYSALDSSSPSKMLMPGMTIGGDSSTRKLAFSYSQPILQNFLFIPSDINVLRMATSSRKIAKLAIMQAAENITFSAYVNYINLIINDANIMVKSNSFERARVLLKRNQDNRGLGLAEDTDILGSKALVIIRDTDYESSRNSRIEIVNALKQLMNDPSDFEVGGDFSIQCAFSTNAGISMGDVETALSNRIELKLLNEQLRLQTISLLMAKGKLLPQLNLIGSASSYGNDKSKDNAYTVMKDNDNPSWTVGLNLVMPLYPLAEVEDMKKQQMDLEKTRNNIAKTKLQIANQVSAQVRSIVLLQKQLAQVEEVSSLQKQRLQKEEEKFRVGRSSTRVVIQAQDDLNSAETQAIALQWRYYIGLLSLELYKGQLLRNCNEEYYNRLTAIK